MSNYKILHTQLKDLDLACQLFDEAIKWQKRKGYPVYRNNDREAQKADIKKKQHYKLMDENEIAAIFSVWYADEGVWRSRDNNDSIFLHRVVTNQKHKGLRIFQYILDWSIQHAQNEKRQYIRLDTWDDNPPLINYYKSFGFDVVEHFQIPNTEEFQLNCRGNKVILMEYKVSV